MHSNSLRTANFLLVLLVLVFSCVFANPEDYIEESENEEPIYSLQEYLSRLANSRNRLYDSYYGSNYMVPDMLRDRRRSRAENNFQLRVRKRATPMAESNFQLRVRKDILNRIRSVPQIRSAAENNFQLRVRKAGSAERNFQLRVRRSGNEENQPDMDYVMEPDYFNRHVRQTLLDQIRDRRFGRRPMAENNFQLRI